MKLLHSEVITNLAARLLVPDGKYKGIFIAFDGVNQAAQTLVSGNCGTIQLLVDGKEKSRIDFDILVDIINLEYGVCEEVSGAGAAFRHAVYFPFHLPDDKDVCYTVGAQKRVEIVHNFSQATSTVVASGNVIYYGVMADEVSVTPYELRFNNHHITLGAAGTSPHKIFQDNIYKLYIENDTNLTSLSVIKDGASFIEICDRDNLYSLSQMLRRIETFSSTLAYFDLDIAGSDENIAAQNDDVDLILTAGAACTVNIGVLSVDMTPKKLASSFERRNMAVATKARRKVMKGVSSKVVASIEAEKIS